ncbi:sterol esterase [Mycena sanguinolenta]|nr:sterol esterase [Mycena sanguinolenta]
MLQLFLIPLHALIYVQFTMAGTSTVFLPYGTFQGSTTGNATQFLGVPFAQAARFQSPKEPASLRGIQNATSFGPACPQQRLSPIPDFVASTYPSVSENCLSLNVFRPTIKDPSVKLPVFVWIHGGGFEVGSSRDYDLPPVVEQSIQMAQPIIAVTANYRLNALGFLGGKEVAEAGISNLGLRDQIFALEWVQKYISLFGGDPDKVVMGGVSAGSMSTTFLFLDNYRNTNSLFGGVFLQSGPAVHIGSLADGQSDYDTLAAATNCNASSDSLNCLRHVPFDTLITAVNNTADIFSYRSLNLIWAPRIDGDIIERNPWASISEGMYAKIPMLAGMSDDEGTLFSLSTLNITTDIGFVDYVKSNYFPNALAEEMAHIASLYPADPTQGSPFGTGTANELTPGYKRLAAFQGDILITSPRRFLLGHASARQNIWSWLNKIGKTANGPLGAYHGSDTPIWFTTSSSAGTEGINALINFINTLDPNMSATNSSAKNSLPIPWPKWNSTAVSDGFGALLTFGDNETNITAEDFRVDAVDFLNELRLAEANTVN